MFNVMRLFKSFRYAFKGFLKVLKEEQNIRVQLLVAFFVFMIAWYLKIENIEWALLVFVTAIVILMEIVNSAIERVSDVLKPRINTYVKEIKDIMAAAVMFASIVAVVVGLIIFLPYIKDLI